MPALINSAPDCVTHNEGADTEDMADFILQGNYGDCAGFMTFGPGSTYGEEGAEAAGAYYALIGIGAAVVLAVFIAWVLVENRRLVTFAARQALPGNGQPPGQPPAGQGAVTPPTN